MPNTDCMIQAKTPLLLDAFHCKETHPFQLDWNTHECISIYLERAATLYWFSAPFCYLPKWWLRKYIRSGTVNKSVSTAGRQWKARGRKRELDKCCSIRRTVLAGVLCILAPPLYARHCRYGGGFDGFLW